MGTTGDRLAVRIGHRLLVERTRLGLNQNDVARAAGITQPAYSQLERGERLNFGTLVNCARALRVPVGTLLPLEEQGMDAQGLTSLLAELDADQRGAFVEGVLALLEAWRHRDARNAIDIPHSRLRAIG